jgi:FdhD protein
LSSVRRALAALEDRQTLNRLTHALHGAAWADHGGELSFVREDVGRHNALDKLIGALLRAGVDPASGFVVITSRCSYEMVEKAAMFGARTLVAVSAPTTFAIERAQANAMTLLALARADGAICFTDPAFVTDDLQSEGRRIA